MRFLTKCLLLLGIAASMLTSISAAPFTALRDGESFRYKIGWGVFGSAGEVTIKAQRETLDNRPIFRIRTVISSRGMVRGFYTFDDRGELVVDEATGRILSATDEGRSGSKRLESRTVFDYERKVGIHTDVANPSRSREFPLPEGTPIDLISGLIATRDWNLALGDRRDALVYFGRDIYPITLRAEEKERVNTPMGRFETTVLVPRMETEAPRGVFKRGGEIKVWVSQGSTPLPVKMQLKLNIGTAVLSLVEHQPGQPGA